MVLGLILSSTAIANQLSKSPFIPDDVYNEFNKLPKDHKIKFCGFEYFEPDYYIINIENWGDEFLNIKDLK